MIALLVGGMHDDCATCGRNARCLRYLWEECLMIALLVGGMRGDCATCGRNAR